LGSHGSDNIGMTSSMKLLLLLSRFENRELQKVCVLCMEPIVCDLYI